MPDSYVEHYQKDYEHLLTTVSILIECACKVRPGKAREATMSRLSKMRIIALAILCGGCAQHPGVVEQQASDNLLREDLFPAYMLKPVESGQEIFALTPQAQSFVENTQSKAKNQREKIRQLIEQIFDHAALGLTYRSTANTNASATFENSVANCLSLSIMTYAMARHAGLSPQFYQVDIPEYWTRREGVNLLNGHINLRISPARAHNDLIFAEAFADVDFDPQDMRAGFSRHPISKQRVIAMFYNNKGADALLANSYSDAYRYFRAAVTTEPSFSQGWVNLGVLYRRLGENRSALASYHKALEYNPRHLTAWENLAILYKATGRAAEGDEILAKLDRERNANPFYHMMLGEEALARKLPRQALRHFQEAVRRDRYQHEIYHGLAKAYLALGNDVKAQKFLARARKLAIGDDIKTRYESKLLALRSL